MAGQRQSPFANQPFDVAASNTESMIEEWLRQRRLPDTPEVSASRPPIPQCADCLRSPTAQG
jgi:hypothetical protein